MQGILTKAVQHHHVHRGALRHPIKLRLWCTISRTARIVVLPSLITTLLLFCYIWNSPKAYLKSNPVRLIDCRKFEMTAQLQWPAMFLVHASTSTQQPHKPVFLVFEWSIDIKARFREFKNLTIHKHFP